MSSMNPVMNNAIPYFVERSCHLRSLELGCNSLTDDEVKIIAINCKELTTLDLGKCYYITNEGVMCIGIATECGHAFGLSPYSGRLSSLYRPSPGCKIEANSDPPEELQHCSFTAQLHVDSCGSPTNLKGRANGAIVEIIVDADAGTVQFRLTRNCTVPGSSYTIINRSPVVTAISGLPRGVQLRPWCRLFDVPDRVTMSGFWSHA